MKSQYIKYRNTNISIKSVKPIRDKICKACRRKGKTDLHHFAYVYPTKLVKKNHILALENTIELCYRCHRIANAMRICDDNSVITVLIKSACDKL